MNPIVEDALRNLRGEAVPRRPSLKTRFLSAAEMTPADWQVVNAQHGTTPNASNRVGVGRRWFDTSPSPDSNPGPERGMR